MVRLIIALAQIVLFGILVFVDLPYSEGIILWMVVSILTIVYFYLTIHHDKRQNDKQPQFSKAE